MNEWKGHANYQRLFLIAITYCPLGCLDVVPWHNINEEVEGVIAGHSHGDVIALKGAALVLLGVGPSPHRELADEDFQGLAEKNQRLGGNHLQA